MSIFLIIRLATAQNPGHHRKDIDMNAELHPASAPTDLDAFWMPFTANRQFKANPRLLARAKGMHYWTQDGRRSEERRVGKECVP